MSTGESLSKSDQKRLQILDAGRELFMSQGYADTSMDQVTAKSGVSKATVYNHFPSKELLFEEAVRTRSEEVFAALPQLDVEHTDPEEMLTHYFHALLGILFSEDGACMCFLLMSEGRRFPDNARLIYESGFGRGLEEMCEYLSRANRTEKIKVTDPEWAARRLLAVVMPPLPMMCAGFEPLQPPEIPEVRRAVQFFLRGIADDCRESR